MAFHSPGHENQSKNGSNPYAKGGGADSAPASSQAPKPGQKPNKGKKGKKAKGPQQQTGAQGAGGQAHQKTGAQAAQNANTASAGTDAKPAGNNAGAHNAAQNSTAGNAQDSAPNSGQDDAAKGVQKGAGQRGGQSWKSTFSAGSVQGKDGRVYEERSIMHIDPFSALKVGFLLSASLFLVWIVAALLIYMSLGIAGVWDKLNGLIGDLTGSGEFGFGTYFGVVFALGLVELVILTLLAPVAAVAYNASAQLLGGLRIKLDN